MPRSYVRMERDNIEDFDARAFVSAARQGHVYGTTGPLLEVELGDAGPGDLFTGNQAVLEVSVRAAPWVPVSTLRIYRNGNLDREIAIDGSTMQSIEMSFERDAYLVIEVEGEAGEEYAAILPNFTPLAFSNPIFIDADRDGLWTPPGLSAN
jgi:hypothetical protein